MNPKSTMKYDRFLARLVLLLIAAISTSEAQKDIPNSDEDFRPREVRESLQRYSETLAQVDSMSPEQAIPKLGEMMVRTSRWRDAESMAISSRAQQKLLSIPGHATYYRDKLKAGEAGVLAGTMPLWQWENLTMNSFEPLEHLPSEETVEVLAGFVDDNFSDTTSTNPEDTNYPGFLVMEAGHYIVNCPAAAALEALGIEQPPYKDRPRRFGEFKTLWSQWWQEVKAGKRKYRFKGSDVLHPVNAPPGTGREVRRPERYPGSPSVAKTLENPASKPTDEVKAERPNLHWPVFAAIVGVLLAGLVYWQKVRGR